MSSQIPFPSLTSTKVLLIQVSVQNTWSALFWFYCLNTSDCFPTQILEGGWGGVGSSEHWELLKAFGFKNFHDMTFFSSGQDSCSSHVSHNFLIFNKNKRIPNTSIQVAWLGSFLQKYFCAVDILTWSTVCLRPNADTWRANSVNSITYWLSTQSKSCFFSYPMYVQAPNKGVSSKSTKADVTDLLLPRQPYN